MFFTASISASFTLFYGGAFQDSFVAFFIGILLFLLLFVLGKFHANSFFQNIFGSALVAGLSLFTTAMGWTIHYDKMIIGTLMNLVPGIAITNVMRDILGGDLLAGIIKLVDSFHGSGRYCVGSRYGNFYSALFLPGNLRKRRMKDDNDRANPCFYLHLFGVFSFALSLSFIKFSHDCGGNGRNVELGVYVCLRRPETI